APIGGALNPMGFNLSSTAGAKVSSGPGVGLFVGILVASAIIAAGAAFYFLNKEHTLQNDKAALERQIEEKSYIEEIIAERDAAEARAVDIQSMEASTYQLNEQALEFINNLEDKVPTNVVIQSFSANNDSISIPATATSYDEIADFIMQLKTIKCIDDVYVASVAQSKGEDGEKEYTFSCTCVYTNPNVSTDTDAEEE
ncbi:MAG: PilN domain-containing protein, partial [Acholeplasmatales bacterium]|nr:PilN domain-containing protein [Acholeplasmatales bacterium]